MIQLVYLSFFSRDLDAQALEEILAVSRRNNAALGITGLLVVKGRAFLQVLEGEKAVVYALYERIKQDDRHKDIMKISEENITERVFAHWSMGFKNLDALSPLESEKLLNLNNIDLTEAAFATNRSEIHALFQAFIEINQEISQS